MGLDMYLEGERYLSEFFCKGDKKRQAAIAKIIKEFEGFEVKTVVARLGYWRKANAIHAWFVKNVQDGVDECQRSSVEVEQLEELLGIVNQVLKDNSLAPTLLPTQKGFFFGSQEYDSYYMDDLKLTKTILEKTIKLKKSKKGKHLDLYYRASW